LYLNTCSRFYVNY